jgi:hypothetical protein
MTRKAWLGVLGALTLVLVVGVTAEAQLAKQGKYRGMFSIRSTGTTHEIEQGHVFFTGTSSGVFFNDVANGFLDKSAVECPEVADIVNGRSIGGHGYCIVTDKDGDKAFGVWQGKSTGPNVDEGDLQWTGGTGKYSGLKGNNTWRYIGIGTTPAGWSVWEGEWQLP